MVGLQAVLHGLFLIIVALIKAAAAFVADTFHFGRIEGNMVGGAAGLADAPARYAGYQFAVRYDNIDYAGQFNTKVVQDTVQCNSLFFRTGKPV